MFLVGGFYSFLSLESRRAYRALAVTLGNSRRFRRCLGSILLIPYLDILDELAYSSRLALSGNAEKV